MASADDLLAVIDRIYAAPVTEDGWAGALGSLSRLFNASLSTYSGGPVGGATFRPTFMHHDGVDHAAVDAYAAYYHSICRRGIYSQNESVGEVYYDYKYFTESQIARDEYYDFVTRNGGKYAMGATLARPRAATGPSGLQQCAIHFSKQHGHPEKEAVTLFQKIVPHMIRANQIQQTLTQNNVAASGAFSALDRSASAIIGVDEHLKTCFVNQAAERVLANADGISILRRRITLAAPQMQRRLDGALSAMAAEDAFLGGPLQTTFAVERPSGAQPFVLFLSPVTLSRTAAFADHSRAPRILVTISDLSSQLSVSKQVLAEVFGLTDAEAELSLALANGQTLNGYCAAQAISVETGRWHLNNVFSKTGANRQSALIRMICKIEIPTSGRYN